VGSEAYISAVGEVSPLPRAPEICVEVMSQSNSDEEIKERTRAYLAAGAKEVWLATADGTIRYFDVEGERSSSAFPVSIPPIPKAAP
jgi:Uma2 family endonuclease